MFDLGGTKNADIVRMACHPSKGGSVLDQFYLFGNASHEKMSDYCKTVLQYHNPAQPSTPSTTPKNNAGEGNKETDSDKDDDKSDFSVIAINVEDVTQCVMSDCKDVCDGCSVNFYHNKILEDDIFAPNSIKASNISPSSSNQTCN